MNKKILKKSPFVFYYKINKEIGSFYNSVTMDVIFGKNSFFKKIDNNKKLINFNFTKQNEIKALEVLKKNGFLVKKDNSFNKIKQASIRSTDLIAMYLILTENCNFRCRYCAFFSNLPQNYKPQVMSREMASRALELFSKSCSKNKKRKKSIVLYGGEPLLNFDTFKYVAMAIRDKNFEKKCGGNIEIVTFTNGSLITSEIAKFCGKYRIKVIVSLDGPKKIHDSMRIDTNKNGTFDRIVAGYFLLQKYGCEVGISATVASHNFNRLPAIISFFKKNLKPINIGLNPLHASNDGDKNSWSLSLEKSSYAMIEAFKKSRKLGLYIEQVMKRVRPFVEKTPRIKDCPSCGGLIRFYPSGNYGPCGHFVSMGKNCLSINDAVNWEKSKIKKDWSSRSSFSMGKTCKQCPAISICGGGCPLNAYKINGNIMSIDNRICIQSKIFLEWLINDLYDIIKSKYIKKSLVLSPNKNDRKKIYGQINMLNKKLPLQQYSKFGEIHE